LRSSTKQGRSYGFSATWTSIVRSVGSATLASTTASVVMLSLITYGMTEQVFPVTLMEVIIKSLQSIQQQLKVSYGTQHMPLALLSTVVPSYCSTSQTRRFVLAACGLHKILELPVISISTIVKAPPTSTAFAADRCGSTYGDVERAAGCEYLAAGKLDHDVACGSCKRASGAARKRKSRRVHSARQAPPKPPTIAPESDKTKLQAAIDLQRGRLIALESEIAATEVSAH
jgi:hypothetical protein